MDLEKEIKFFDEFEKEHGEYDVLTEGAYQRILDVLAARLHPKAGMKCVDLGCGTGAFTRRLGKLGLDMTGVDISQRSIERASAGGGGEFVVGDICHCQLPSASFDFVVMSGVLHHLTMQETRTLSLREALRLLKPGGRFFSYDPNGRSPSMLAYRHPRSPVYSAEGKTDNEILFHREQIGEELAAVGFTEVDVRGLSGITYRFVKGRFAQRLLTLYNRVYEPMIRYSPFESQLGTFLIATAAKPAAAASPS